MHTTKRGEGDEMKRKNKVDLAKADDAYWDCYQRLVILQLENIERMDKLWFYSIFSIYIMYLVFVLLILVIK